MKRIILSIISLYIISTGAIIAAPIPEDSIINEKKYNVEIHDLNNVPITNDIKNEIKENAKVTNTSKIESLQKDDIIKIREHALFLYNTNKIIESLQMYQSIPEEKRTSEDNLFLANLSQDIQKTDDTVYYLKKSIELDDKNYKAHYNLGNIYFDEKQYNAAINEYNKALKIKKDFAYAHFNKGCCYLAKNSLVNARYEFGLAIKSNPNEPAFFYNLAYTNKLMKKEKKAQEALDIYNQMMSQ